MGSSDFRALKNAAVADDCRRVVFPHRAVVVLFVKVVIDEPDDGGDASGGLRDALHRAVVGGEKIGVFHEIADTVTGQDHLGRDQEIRPWWMASSIAAQILAALSISPPIGSIQQLDGPRTLVVAGMPRSLLAGAPCVMCTHCRVLASLSTAPVASAFRRKDAGAVNLPPKPHAVASIIFRRARSPRRALRAPTLPPTPPRMSVSPRECRTPVSVVEAVDQMAERKRRRRRERGLGLTLEHPVGRTRGEHGAARRAEPLIDDFTARADDLQPHHAVLLWRGP